jgi:hypothetical protein
LLTSASSVSTLAESDTVLEDLGGPEPKEPRLVDGLRVQRQAAHDRVVAKVERPAPARQAWCRIGRRPLAFQRGDATSWPGGVRRRRGYRRLRNRRNVGLDTVGIGAVALRDPERRREGTAVLNEVVALGDVAEDDPLSRKQRLVKNYGYCEICSTDVLNFVASIFARGDAKD